MRRSVWTNRSLRLFTSDIDLLLTVRAGFGVDHIRAARGTPGTTPTRRGFVADDRTAEFGFAVRCVRLNRRRFTPAVCFVKTAPEQLPSDLVEAHQTSARRDLHRF